MLTWIQKRQACPANFNLIGFNSRAVITFHFHTASTGPRTSSNAFYAVLPFLIVNMAGRRRRASTSSVETVDNSQIRWRKETSVVKSVPKGTSLDDWPVFELQDAIVLNKDGETIENALHVSHRGPFIVKGNLIIDDPSQKANRTQPRARLPSRISQFLSSTNSVKSNTYFSSSHASTLLHPARDSTMHFLLYWRIRRWKTVDLGLGARRLVRD